MPDRGATKVCAAVRDVATLTDPRFVPIQLDVTDPDRVAVWSLTNAACIVIRRQGTQVVGVYAGPVDTDMTAVIDLEKIPRRLYPSQSTGEAMIILRFKIRSKPDKSDELMSALAEIITPARATNGVINFDIARDLLDPDSFIATAIYDDGAALELQESLPEVDRVMAMLPESLVAPPERAIFDASLDPTLV